jgi:hypothetical protein
VEGWVWWLERERERCNSSACAWLRPLLGWLEIVVGEAMRPLLLLLSPPPPPPPPLLERVLCGGVECV